MERVDPDSWLWVSDVCMSVVSSFVASACSVIVGECSCISYLLRYATVAVRVEEPQLDKFLLNKSVAVTAVF